jgi:hypothetical protein
MSYRPQRDPFNDGLETVISAMKIDKRLPGPKDENLQSLGKKIINNAKTRPEFARKVVEFYTNEDSWLSGFLKKAVASAKPAITPIYNGGGSVPGKSDEPDQDVMDTEGESGSESGSESEAERAEGAAGAAGAAGAEVTIQEVSGDFDLDKFEKADTPTRDQQAEAIKSILPPNSSVVIEKKGKTSKVRIYVENQEGIESLKRTFADMYLRLKDDTDAKNMKKLLKFITTPKNNVIIVKPTNVKIIAKKQFKVKKSPKVQSTPNTPTRPEGGGATKASQAVSEYLAGPTTIVNMTSPY